MYDNNLFFSNSFQQFRRFLVLKKVWELGSIVFFQFLKKKKKLDHVNKSFDVNGP